MEVIFCVHILRNGDFIHCERWTGYFCDWHVNTVDVNTVDVNTVDASDVDNNVNCQIKHK